LVPAFASSFSDIFEDLFGMAGATADAAAGRERGCRPALQHGNHARGSFPRQEPPRSRFSGFGDLRILLRHRRGKLAPSRRACGMCGGRRGGYAQAQGIFSHGWKRTCPGLFRGRGPDDRRPVPPHAQARGRVTRARRTLAVNIPQGVEDGPRAIRLCRRRRGPGVRGGPAGAISTFFLSLATHPFFFPGATGPPICIARVPILDGDGGARRRIRGCRPSRKGKTKVKVPSGTQSSRRFPHCIKGDAGAPLTSDRGYVRGRSSSKRRKILTKKQQELLTEFEKLSSGATQTGGGGFSSLRSRTSSVPAALPKALAAHSHRKASQRISR